MAEALAPKKQEAPKEAAGKLRIFSRIHGLRGLWGSMMQHLMGGKKGMNSLVGSTEEDETERLKGQVADMQQQIKELKAAKEQPKEGQKPAEAKKNGDGNGD